MTICCATPDQVDFCPSAVKHDRVTKLEHPWCDRNKKPILEVLRRVLPDAGTVLEVGSGSGQHAAFFSRQLAGLTWLPSDIDDESLESIRPWRSETDRRNLLEPIRLDVVSDQWPVDRVDVIFNANMVHITPWDCCLGLLAGARRHLVKDGLLIIYGPFRIGGRHTAESNENFDRDLRDRDPSWGIRDLEAIQEAAVGLELEDRYEMPANNLTLIFRRK